MFPGIGSNSACVTVETVVRTGRRCNIALVVRYAATITPKCVFVGAVGDRACNNAHGFRIWLVVGAAILRLRGLPGAAMH